MKKTGFFFLFLLCSITILLSTNQSRAQYFVWLPAVALSDSSADNTNPWIIEYTGSFMAPQTLMFWERSTDSSATSIMYSVIENGLAIEAQVLFSAPGVHFTHPVAFRLDYPIIDTAFYLFFESDESGDKDIYMSKFSMDGNFTPAILFAGNPGNDENLCAGGSWQRYVSWINEGRLMVSHYDPQTTAFLPQEILDPGNNSSPAAGESLLAYLNETDSTSGVQYFIRDSQSGAPFLGPQVLFEQGENKKLCRAISTFENSNLNTLAWQNRTDSGKWGIEFVSMFYGDSTLYEYKSTDYNYQSPSLFEMDIITRLPTFITFVTDSLGNDEVMTAWAPGIYEIFNQSNFPGPDRNPRFFFSLNNYAMRINLLWESFREGHWTLFASYYDMVFGTSELKEPFKFQVSPNPFHERTSISLQQLDGPASVVITDCLGIPVRSFTVQPTGKEKSGELSWDGLDIRGNEVPAGIYILNCRQGSKSISSKILKN